MQTLGRMDEPTLTKVCLGCGIEKPLEEFQRAARARDGRRPRCKVCQRDDDLLRKSGQRELWQGGRKPHAGRDGDRVQARRRIQYLVRRGVIPSASELPCTDCGHVWLPGEPRHSYDHARGYGPGHHDDAEPVCSTCQGDRTRRRGEGRGMRRRNPGRRALIPDADALLAELRREHDEVMGRSTRAH